MMISLLLLKIIYVLTNFLILSDTFLFKYFLLYVYFKENWDFANDLNNMTLLSSLARISSNNFESLLLPQ